MEMAIQIAQDSERERKGLEEGAEEMLEEMTRRWWVLTCWDLREHDHIFVLECNVMIYCCCLSEIAKLFCM